MLVEVRGKMKTKVGREARLSHLAQARVCYCMRSRGKLGMSKSQTAVFQALDADAQGFLPVMQLEDLGDAALSNHDLG